MIFDKSIIEGKLPFSCINCRKAEEFLDKEGYFTDNILEFTKSSFKVTTYRDKLYDIDSSNSETSFQSSTDGTFYKYFLPKEWVKEEEKKYRPFTLAEWIEKHTIGEVINYKDKSEGIVAHHMYMGYAHGIGKNIKDVGVGAITLGVASYNLTYLFDYYEIEINGEWKPFGIRE